MRLLTTNRAAPRSAPWWLPLLLELRSLSGSACTGSCTPRRAMGSTSPGFQRRRSEGGAGLSRAGPGHPPGRDGDGTLWAVRGAWVGAVHRWSGRLAVLISVPVSAVPVCHGLPDLRRSGDRTLTIRLFLLWSFCFQNVDPDSRSLTEVRPGRGLVLTGVTALWVTGGCRS